VVGVDHKTVHNDLKATGENSPVLLPDRVIGKDGKSRPAKKPKPAPPPSVMAKGRRVVYSRTSDFLCAQTCAQGYRTGGAPLFWGEPLKRGAHGI